MATTGFIAPQSEIDAPTPQAQGFVAPQAEIDAAKPFTAPSGDVEGSQALDLINGKTAAELAAQPDFKPAQFYAQNKDILTPEHVDKLADTLKQRTETGLTTDTAVEGLKSVPDSVKGFFRGGWQFLKHAPSFAPTAGEAAKANTYVRGVGFRGNPEPATPLTKEGENKRTQDQAEALAGLETAGTGVGSLFRNAIRNIVNQEGTRVVAKLIGVDPTSLGAPAERLNADVTNPGTFTQPTNWKQRLFDDAALAEQQQKDVEGKGPVMQALGTDADTLAKQGVTLDPSVIQDLSAFENPVNFVPFGEGAGGLITSAAGKVLGRAISRDAAEAAIKGLGGAVTKAGELTVKGGEKLGKLKTGVGGVAVGALIHHSPYLAGAITAAPTVLKYGGQVISAAGRLAEKAAAPALNLFIKTAEGAAGGATVALPFAAASDDPTDITANLGTGAALGAGGHLLGEGVRSTKAAALGQAENIVAKSFQAAHDTQPIAAHPEYETGGPDTQSAEAVNELRRTDPATANLAERLKHLASGLNTDGAQHEVYFLSPSDYDTYVGKELGEHAVGTRGVVVPSTLKDGTQVSRAYVRLDPKEGATQALHEVGHVVMNAMPEDIHSDFVGAIKDTYGKHFEDFWKEYSKTAPEGVKYSERYVADEIGAELLSGILRGIPLDNTPLPLRQKAVQAAAHFLDLTGIYQPGLADNGPLATELGIKLSPTAAAPARNFVEQLRRKVGESPAPANGYEGPTPPKIETPAAEPFIAPEHEREVAPTPPTETGLATPIPAELKQRVPNNAAPEPGAEPGLVTAIPPELKTQPSFGKRASVQQPEVTAREPEVENLRGKSAKDYEKFQGEARNPALQRVEEAKAAVDASKDLSDEQKTAVQTLLSNLRTPHDVVYNSAKNEAGSMERAPRRADIEAARGNPELREVASKLASIPLDARATKNGGVQLQFWSGDKVLSNLDALLAQSKAHEFIPYAKDEYGKLPQDSQTRLAKDLQNYTANQDNGYRGDGEKLNRPANPQGFIPDENPDYTPAKIPQDKARFLNLLMGEDPPETARMNAGTVPIQARAKALGEANANKGIEIKPRQAYKKPFENVTLSDYNPLRVEMQEAGVNTSKLTEAHEWVNAKDIKSATPRPDIKLSPTSTDVTAAGFMPAKSREANDEVRKIASGYTREAGIPYVQHTGHSEVNQLLSKRVADFYQEAQHDPTNPEVRKSYDALAKETKAQWDYITQHGVEMEPYTGKGEPYKNSAEMMSDVRDNKHLWFFPTDQGFGSTEVETHPMLEKSGVKVGGKELLVNDLFRAVHDYFGHAKEGYEFGPRGELNAYLSHSAMYSNEARPAMAAETMAQNSWVNFGKHLRDAEGNIPKRGELGYVAPQDRPFAEQKATVLPQDLMKETGMQFMPSKEPRAVKTAAVRDEETGKVYEGPMHAMAILDYLQDKHPDRDPETNALDAWNSHPNVTEGFTTHGGEFLNREESFNRAEEMGQYTPHPSEDDSLESQRFNRQQNGGEPEQVVQQFLPAKFWMDKAGKVKSTEDHAKEFAEPGEKIDNDNREKYASRGLAAGSLRAQVVDDTLFLEGKSEHFDTLPKAQRRLLENIAVNRGLAVNYNMQFIDGFGDDQSDPPLQFMPAQKEVDPWADTDWSKYEVKPAEDVPVRRRAINKENQAHSVGEPIKAVHFSGAGGDLKEVDPAFMRLNSTGASWEPNPKRSFFYVDGSEVGNDAKKFGDRAAYSATIDGKRIYDATGGDPLNFFKDWPAKANDKAIQKAGFDGVLMSAENGTRKIVMMYQKTPVDFIGTTDAEGRMHLNDKVVSQFMPAKEDVDLKDYVGKPLFVLTTDRMGVGHMEVGPTGAKQPLDIPAQGGRGFMHIYKGGGWAFADQAAAKRFLTRVKQVAGDNNSAIAALTVLGENNHMNSPTGLAAYHQALKAAVDSGAIGKGKADRHIKEIFSRLGETKSKLVTDKNRELFQGIKTLGQFGDAVRNKEFNFEAAKHLMERANQRTLPINWKDAQKLGIDVPSIAKDIRDPGLHDVPTGQVVGLVEIPKDAQPEKSDFHFSYPWTVEGKTIGFLKDTHHISNLTTDKRIYQAPGRVGAQPLMTVMPHLDNMEHLALQFMPAKGAKPAEKSLADRLRERVRRAQIVSVDDAVKTLGEYPKYLDGVVNFLSSRREALKNGDVTARDLAKAYAITVASQGSDSIKLSTLQKSLPGFNPDKSFLTADGEKIRPEEAAAWWLGTTEGKKALDNVQTGKYDAADWEGFAKVRKAFGDDRVFYSGMLLKPGESAERPIYETDKSSRAVLKDEAGNPKPTGKVRKLTMGEEENSMANLEGVLDKINEAKGDKDKLMEAVQNLRGIGPAKAPFISHMLGFGGDITLDAVEMNYWLTGKANIKHATPKDKEFVDAVKHEEGSQAILKDRIVKRLMQVREQSPAAAAIPEEAFLHVMHHWLWDKAKGSETTHEGVYHAAMQFMPKKGEELVVAAAIRMMPDGKVFDAGTHKLAAARASDFGYSEAAIDNADGGFITSKGRFVNRVAASRVAVEAGQLPKEFVGHELDASALKDMRGTSTFEDKDTRFMPKARQTTFSPEDIRPRGRSTLVVPVGKRQQN